MIDVHRTDRFDRSLEKLRQDGGEAAMAADKAELLIREIAQGRSSSLERRWKTNNGEARIDGCRKFYIGRRYRLVCVKEDKQILLLLAGTHDDCDRWLERNRGASFGMEPMPTTIPSAPESAMSFAVVDGVQEVEIHEEVSQRELRLIFRGLCGS